MCGLGGAGLWMTRAWKGFSFPFSSLCCEGQQRVARAAGAWVVARCAVRSRRKCGLCAVSLVVKLLEFWRALFTVWSDKEWAVVLA